MIIKFIQENAIFFAIGSMLGQPFTLSWIIQSIILVALIFLRDYSISKNYIKLGKL